MIQRDMAEVCPDIPEEAEDPTLTCALDILEAHRVMAGSLLE